MLNLSTITLKDLVRDYGPLFTAGAGLLTATIASFAARAAMRSARASELNVETAKQSMQIANRAYVSVKEVKWITHVADDSTPQIEIRVHNVGKTPAQHLKFARAIELRDTMFDIVPEPKLGKAALALAPNQEVGILHVLFQVTLTPEQVKDLDDYKMYLYFWGYCTYMDVFGLKHTTSWCYRYNKFSEKQVSLHSTNNHLD